MIEKINDLKSKVDSNEVKQLCETAISVISSTIYNSITPDAKNEIERVTVNNLFEQLAKHKEPIVIDWLANQKRLFTVKNLGIRESINTLKESKELNQVLEHFKTILDSGVHEACLYEQYITALTPFNYFPNVGNAIQEITNRVDNYKNDVDITKIIETMKQTRSNYLVPLIEDVVNMYLSNKNMQTKNQLVETLVKFTYDPYVRDIRNILTLDATELQLEYANSQCDIKKIYSPVIYLGENEAAFAVNKEYYIKKGNNISRMSNVEILKLDEQFKTLCETLSNPNVIVERDGITVYYGKDKAFITESQININDKVVSQNEIKELESISEWSGNKPFYKLVEFLSSSIKDIAEIDFVKTVYLKENENHFANVFKVRDNVFITTNNPDLAKSTFYRNVNPLQAKNIMMEHLRYDVTSLFKGLIQNEEKINEEIQETKEEYISYINELQTKINEFRSNPYAKDINETVISALEDELNEVKNELKDYLNTVEKYLRAEAVNEDISIDVNVNGKKYTVPIPQEKQNGETKDQSAGTEVGKEEIEDKPASAVTFGEDTEMVGDTPTIPEDKIDLGSEEAEAEADDVEKEKETEEKEKSDDNDIKIDDTDSDNEDKEELKADDKEKTDEEDEEKKKEKNESTEGNTLKKEKFVKESDTPKETNTQKKKVYLIKKKES